MNRKRLFIAGLGLLIPWLAPAQRSAPSPGKLPITTLLTKEILGDEPVYILYSDRWDGALAAPDSAFTYSIARQYKPDSAGYWLHTRSYSVATGKLIFEARIGPKRKVTETKEWFPDGKPKSEANYVLVRRSYQPDGLARHWYASGQLRREGKYRRGKARAEHCYAEDGHEVPCQTWFIPPFLPGIGDVKAVSLTLVNSYRQQVKQLPNPAIAQGQWLQLEFRIDSLGNVREPRVYPHSAPGELREIGRQLIRSLGRFEPARLEGQPTSERFYWAIKD